jgi:hypothetical protein
MQPPAPAQVAGGGQDDNSANRDVEAPDQIQERPSKLVQVCVSSPPPPPRMWEEKWPPLHLMLNSVVGGGCPFSSVKWMRGNWQ